jgi:hypothetical protein
MTANVLGLAEVGELEVQMFSFTLMPNRIPNAQFSTSAPILANPCYLLPFFRHSVFVDLSVIRNVRNPKSPAVNEEIKITNFELFMIISLSNASKVTKIDIVNPIPPKSPTPKIDFQFRSVGSLQSPRVTAKKVIRKMPKEIGRASCRETLKIKYGLFRIRNRKF